MSERQRPEGSKRSGERRELGRAAARQQVIVSPKGVCRAPALWGRVAHSARKIFKEEGAISFPLVALIASKIMGDIPEKAKRKLSQELVANLDVFSEEALNQYRQILSENHGVTEPNQKSVLLPIGMDPESFDIALMNDLNAFGGSRGNIAHTFSVIRNELTLGDVDRKVQTITDGLRKIDLAVCANLARQMP